MSRFSPDPFHQAVRGARLHYAVALDRTLPFTSEFSVISAPLAEADKSFDLAGAFTAVIDAAQSAVFTREFEAQVEVDAGNFDISFSLVNALGTVTNQADTLVFTREIELVVSP
jgi:hypothetical protein